MRVLACDPGYDRLGVAVLEKQLGTERLLYSACITTNKASALPERLAEMGAAFTALLSEYAPTHVALETLYFSKNVRTAMAVAEARGVLLYLARTAGCEIAEYTPQQVKVATTGHGGSDKRQVAAMLPRLLPGIPKGALDDEYDAIAVGLTALASLR